MYITTSHNLCRLKEDLSSVLIHPKAIPRWLSDEQKIVNNFYSNKIIWKTHPFFGIFAVHKDTNNIVYMSDAWSADVYLDISILYPLLFSPGENHGLQTK